MRGRKHHQQSSHHFRIRWCQRPPTANAQHVTSYEARRLVATWRIWLDRRIFKKTVEARSIHGRHFWSRWVREYLTLLQKRQKWSYPTKNFAEGDIVIIADDNLPRNAWSLGLIIETRTDKRGLVRSVKVRTSTTILDRPITKLCLLHASEKLNVWLFRRGAVFTVLEWILVWRALRLLVVTWLSADERSITSQ